MESGLIVDQGHSAEIIYQATEEMWRSYFTEHGHAGVDIDIHRLVMAETSKPAGF